MLKTCMPSMPACIMKTEELILVLSPGLTTIEPMVNEGGQHPSRTCTTGSSVKRSVPVPALVIVIEKLSGVSSLTSP